MRSWIKKASLIASLVGLYATSSLAANIPVPVPSPPTLGARSYVLMAYNSGQVLVGRDADKREEPASLTKMMTAYVVFSELKSGHIHMDDDVRISEKAWREPGSRMFIEVGDHIKVKQLLQGMIVQSGNDASVALAEHVAGTEDTFAQLMNQYAQQLGMTHTHFANATGLPHKEHYTTAHDLAKLARALIHDFPKYYKLFHEKKFTWNNISQYNRNKLLWRDDAVDGLKTGHTESAGYCLVSSAKKEDMRLISVVMGTDSEDARADQSQALLNYGFRFFETHRLYQAGEALTKPRVWKGSEETVPLGLNHDMWVTIPQHRYDQLKATMSVDTMITAPVNKGKTYGSVVVKLGDGVVEQEPLVALNSVKEGGLWRKMVDEVLLMFH